MENDIFHDLRWVTDTISFVAVLDELSANVAVFFLESSLAKMNRIHINSIHNSLRIEVNQLNASWKRTKVDSLRIWGQRTCFGSRASLIAGPITTATAGNSLYYTISIRLYRSAGVAEAIVKRIEGICICTPFADLNCISVYFLYSFFVLYWRYLPLFFYSIVSI